MNLSMLNRYALPRGLFQDKTAYWILSLRLELDATISRDMPVLLEQGYRDEDKFILD